MFPTISEPEQHMINMLGEWEMVRAANQQGINHIENCSLKELILKGAYELKSQKLD